MKEASGASRGGAYRAQALTQAQLRVPCLDDQISRLRVASNSHRRPTPTDSLLEWSK